MQQFDENDAPLTDLIQQVSAGNPVAKEYLYQRIYTSLRHVAHRKLTGKHYGDFQTTALVNEVVLRFERCGLVESVPNRRVFFAVASRAMNQVLIDHYRRRNKLVDGPQRTPNSLDAVLDQLEQTLGIGFEGLQEELTKLKTESPRQHAVIMHRFFAGLTIKETADVLGVSVQTVERDWRLARAKLLQRLSEHDET